MRYFSILRYLVVLLALLCSACGTAVPSIKPYKLDVQQGNVVTSKMLLQLRPGMTKSQVRFIMGTPLIQDSFHGNRWDYVYQMREAGKVTEQRRVILDFENDLLKTVRGDVIPAGSSAPDRAEGQVNTGTRVVEPYKKPEEKSLMNKLKFWDKDDAAKAEITTEKDMVKKESDAVVKVDGVSAVIASDADASKSMLAVPLDVPITPVAEAVVTDAVIAPTEAVAEVGQTVTPITSESVVSSDIKDAVAEVVLPVVASPITDVSGNSPFYESPSGMVFDRQLRSLPEELEPETVAEIPSTRVGNKTMPTPKGLPPENEPSFFDRMLEKIGF
ncbi:MAG: outer membrane protein assembly factor BamE [Methylotenera sp.]|uniref:outer membrane protein assembly factor BamE n=1 Tax=Methylotenera sp. TaxID=2051956 RepID=UPI00271FB61A|nr:outer membrane protein assembly factor BamE [Methylotenera sp.]MDO9150127.1 outer membrane protein assembly factor BamE [Methylotenera sp.]